MKLCLGDVGVRVRVVRAFKNLPNSPPTVNLHATHVVQVAHTLLCLFTQVALTTEPQPHVEQAMGAWEVVNCAWVKLA